MSKHNNIYSILGKLQALTPTPAPAKQDSILKSLNESATPDVVGQLNEKYKGFKERLAEGSKKAATDKSEFAKLAPPKDKITYADKIAGAKKSAVKENEYDDDEDEDEQDQNNGFYVAISNEENGVFVGALQKEGGKWRESIYHGTPPHNWGGGYMSYLTPQDIMQYMHKDFGRNYEIEGPFFSDEEVQDYVNMMSEGEYDARPDKTEIPAYMRKAKAKPGEDWKLNQADLDAHSERNISHSKNIARRSGKTVDEGETSDTPTGRVHKGSYGTSYNAGDDDQDDEVKSNEPKKKGRPAKDTGGMKAGPELQNAFRKTNEGETTDTATGRVHKGSYGTSYDAGDDDFEDVVKSNEPKKKGRPSKADNTKSYDSKGLDAVFRKKTSESINISTFVEDTMAELDAIIVTEKAVSQAQQKFMGMVHATQKGEKAPSKAVATVAKYMGKKDAKDFASTKHKGLPKKVSEGINFAEMMQDQHQSVQEMLEELNSHLEEYKRSGHMSDKLRDALEIHRHTKKKEHQATATQLPATVADIPVHDTELDELARLAGVGTQGETSCNMTGAGHMCPKHGMAECWSAGSGMGGMMEGSNQAIDYDKILRSLGYVDSGLSGYRHDYSISSYRPSNKALATGSLPKGHVEVHNRGGRYTFDTPFGEFTSINDAVSAIKSSLSKQGVGAGSGMGGMMEDKEEKADDDYDNDGEVESEKDEYLGSKIRAARKAGKLEEGGYCDACDRPADKCVCDDEKDVEESVNSMLKLAGMKERPITVAEEYANEPDEQYVDVEAILDQGGDLNRKKAQDPHTANKAANPVSEEVTKMEGKLAALYNSLKVLKK